MRNRFHAYAALVLCSTVAFAQEAPITPVSPGAVNPGSAGTTPLTTPSLLTPSPATQESPSGAFDVPFLPGTAPASSSAEQTPATPSQQEEEGFTLPGGSGYAPLDFTPGQGRFDRKPLSFSTSVRQGYDDNIYGSSGEPGTQPIKGSMTTTLTQGIDLLLYQARFGLSMQANGGAEYYWNRTGDQLIPNGGLSLLFAYKLTPRAQFSAIINGAYTSQPSLSVINGLSESNNGKGYLTANGKFDFLYQWTPRIASDTTYSAAGNAYSGSSQSANDYLDQTLGQTLRYIFSKRVTGVFDLRASESTHNNNSAADLNTYFFLGGFDLTVTRRVAASFRTGLTTQEYKAAGQGTTSSPYAEGSLDYTLTRTSSVSLNGRYGFDNGGNTGTQSTKSTRVGLGYNQAFSPKLRGTASVNYDHSGSSSVFDALSSEQDAVSGSIGVSYAYNPKLSFSANVTRFQVFSDNVLLENSRDTYFLGATYSY